MEKFLPIGSIIKLKGRQAMIVGYNYREVNERLRLHYLLLPYPEGYTKSTDIRIISAAGIEVLEMGYQSDAFILLERYFGHINKMAESLPARDLLSALDEAAKRNQQEV